MRSRDVALAALVAVVIGVLSACSSSVVDGTVEGTVSQVTGTGDDVAAFVVVDDEGNSHRFVPAEGLTCGGLPIGHLREHLVERDRIIVTHDAQGIAVEIRHTGS